MEKSHLLGEFLVKNQVVTMHELLNALEFQRDSLKIFNLMSIMERSLEQKDIEQIMQRQIEAGESLEQAAITLGLLAPTEIDLNYLNDKSNRIPLGKILVQHGVVDTATMENWVERFENQIFDNQNQLPLLKKIPLFEKLSDERLSNIAIKLSYKQYEAGQLIFGENADSDAIYLIESGLVRMSLKTPEGLHELGTFSSNMYFGLNGVLDGRKRGQRAEAVLKSILWKLHREDFQKILRENPEVSFAALSHMSTGLSNVFRTIKGDKSVLKTNIVSIFVDDSSSQCIALVHDIIREIYSIHQNPVQVLYSLPGLNLPLKSTPEAFLVQTRSRKNQTFLCLNSPGLDDVQDFDWLVKWLHQESRSIDSLILIARADSKSGLKKMLLSSSARSLVLLENQIPQDLLTRLKPGRDRLYYIASGKNIHTGAATIHQYLNDEARKYFPQLLHPHQMLTGSGKPSKAAKSLTRWLNGTTLGVAFGGGGARIMAHLGFLELLEAEGVEVDEVAGSSGGAVIAGMLAIGMSSSEIVNFFTVNAINARKNPLVDFTIPIKAMAAGKRFEKLLKKGFGKLHIYETNIPYFPVATDMRTGNEYLARLSPIWIAAKGSAAIPGFHPIVKLNDQLLGDGGILNNVPASVLRKFGSGAVISLNITPNPSGSKLNPDRMLSALVQGIDIMLFQSVEKHLKYTDIESKPNVDGYGTADFAAGLELLERGREEAARHRREVILLVDRLRNRGF